MFSVLALRERGRQVTSARSKCTSSAKDTLARIISRHFHARQKRKGVVRWGILSILIDISLSHLACGFPARVRDHFVVILTLSFI